MAANEFSYFLFQVTIYDTNYTPVFCQVLGKWIML